MEAQTNQDRSAVRVLVFCGGMVVVYGMERMTFEVLRVLRERGGEVHCIVNNWENYRIVPLVEQIGASWSTGYYSYRLDRHTANPLRLAAMAANILRTSAGVIRDAWRFRPTHVFVPDFPAVFHCGPALIVLRALGIQVTMRLGNPPEIGRFYRRLWRWVVNALITRFVCNSRFTQGELLGHGVPARKISYVYNTVPSRMEQTNDVKEPDRGKLIYVGQIIPSKGLDLLLDAIGILVERGLDVKLDVVGHMDGWAPAEHKDYREGLSERAERLDLTGRVRFLGYREDLPALLAGAAIHCCPSRPEQREGFGIVNIEAKKAGIPSVVTPIGALRELITHRVDGWICAEVSAEALAEGIEHFLSDANRREEAGRRARASLERFSRERFAKQWWEVFAVSSTSWAERLSKLDQEPITKAYQDNAR